jgi:hypothetical protein
MVLTAFSQPARPGSPVSRTRLATIQRYTHSFCVLRWNDIQRPDLPNAIQRQLRQSALRWLNETIADLRAGSSGWADSATDAGVHIVERSLAEVRLSMKLSIAEATYLLTSGPTRPIPTIANAGAAGMSTAANIAAVAPPLEAVAIEVILLPMTPQRRSSIRTNFILKS